MPDDLANLRRRPRDVPRGVAALLPLCVARRTGVLRFSPAANSGWSYGEGMTEQSHAITVSHPPAAVLRVANPILRFLLRTPVMGAARKQLMVVSFNGRKTGRQYTIPLSAHRVDGDLYALTPAPWQRNFRDGAAVEVFHDGKTTTMHGELIQDRSVVADLYRRCSESYGVKGAQRMIGLKFRDQRIPTLDEFTEAIERDHLAAILLTPAE